MTNTKELAKNLMESSYNQSRASPSPGEPSFLPLGDVYFALQKFAIPGATSVFDYGCGGSPYRHLFPKAQYHRADSTPIDGIDYLVKEDCTTDAASGNYEIVLSTQVLEHVVKPSLYLREAKRLLAPGGRLLLSTHGAFYDHGCPTDCHRWTAEGLRNELASEGFTIESCYKLTTNFRGLAFLLRNFSWLLKKPRRTPWGFGLFSLRWALEKWGKEFDLWCDRVSQNERMVSDDVDANPFYIGLLIVAKKVG